MKTRDVVLLTTSFAVVLFMFVYTFWHWHAMGDLVPGHISHVGEVTRWAAKPFIFFLPGMALFLLAIVIPFYYFPQGIAIPLNMTFEEKKQHQDLMGTYLFTGLLGIQVMILLFHLEAVRLAAGEIDQGAATLPAILTFLAVMIGSTIVTVIKVKKRLCGIRTVAKDN
ncbi:DUF1648 domain-containing protein [Alteribacter lacisalsi]|uniref:DUF1648 domain-containing protein n=1 Tax=Alteribacter lacisalsi TaxID=2045244 RepID=UPI00137518F7|nr:DUF1648 domain-containing protein [Alteribacter lacisalsi]